MANTLTFQELEKRAAQRAVLLSRAVADRIRPRLLPFPRHHAAELKHDLEKMVAQAWIEGYREAVKGCRSFFKPNAD